MEDLREQPATIPSGAIESSSGVLSAAAPSIVFHDPKLAVVTNQLKSGSVVIAVYAFPDARDFVVNKIDSWSKKTKGITFYSMLLFRIIRSLIGNHSQEAPCIFSI